MQLPVSLVLAGLFLNKHFGLSTQTIKSVVVMQPLLADLIFTENLLYERNASSVSDCAVACLNTDSCALFTLTSSSMSSPARLIRDDTRSLLCRGHSSVVKGISGNVSAPGTVFFIFTPRLSAWLEKPCTNNTECGVPQSECFAGTCLCTPGYYYSHTADSCIDSCPKHEQQESYLRYSAARLKDNNIHCKYRSLLLCKELCRNLAGCRSFDMWYKRDYCCFNAVSPLKEPSAWRVTSKYTNFYSVTCV